MDVKILAKSPFIEDNHSKEKIQLSVKEKLNIQTSVSGMDEENVNGLLREGLQHVKKRNRTMYNDNGEIN